MRGRVLLAVVVVWGLCVLAALPGGARPTHLAFGWLRTTGLDFAVPLAWWIAAWGIGSPLRRRLAPRLADPASAALLAAGLGWAVVQVCAELLGLGGWFSPGPAAVLLAGGLAAAGREAARRGPSTAPPAPWTFAAGAGWALFAAALAPALLSVGAPPLGPDEALYHMRFVDHLVSNGTWVAHAGDSEGGFAQGLHSMLGLSVALAGDGAARPFGFLFALAALVVGHRVAFAAAGATAAALYLPLAVGAATVVRSAPAVSTDFPVGFYVGLAVLVALARIRAPGAGPSVWLLGLLGGAALSIKYTTPLYFAPAYVVVGIALLGRGANGRPALGRLLAAAVLPVLFALPWLVRNAIAYGHPLHPILGMDVPGDPAAWVFNFTANYGAGSGLEAFVATPWELFTLGREFDRRLFLGRLNAWPLLALPLIVLAAARSREARVLALVSLLGFLGWAGALRRVVYLLPLWPTIAALTAVGLTEGVDRLPAARRRAAVAALLIALGVGALVETASPAVDAAGDADLATRMESWEQHPTRPREAEPTHAWIRRNVPEDDCVALFFTSKVYGIPHRTVFAGAEEMTPLRLALARAGTADAMAERLRGWGCRWVLRRAVLWPPEQYPMLTAEQHRAGFEEPVAIADELQERFGVLRFNDGPYRVYELVEGPFAN